MKALVLLAALFASSAHAETALPQQTRDVFQSAINQWVLFASGISHAFPGGQDVPQSSECAMVAQAHVAFLALESLGYNDEQVAELTKYLIRTEKVAAYRQAAAQGTADCGSLL